MTGITRLRAPTSHLSKLYINGVAIHDYGRIEQLWDNVQGAPSLVGEPIHVPLRPGLIDVRQVPGGRDIGFSVVIYASDSGDMAGFNQLWDTFAQMVWSPRTPVIIQRDLEYPGNVIVSTQCRARYVSGLSPTKYESAAGMGKLVLRFQSLDAYWYSTTLSEVVQSSSPGSIVVPGTTETSRATITFHGGSSPVLTNTTTGAWVQYTGGAVGTLVVDVENFTALDNGVNVVGYVGNGGIDPTWMWFVPGTNAFTLTGGGTLSISVRGAYL